MLQRPMKALLLPALLALSIACLAEEGSHAPSQDAASPDPAMAPDLSEGWKDMLLRRREVSGNTVDGIKRYAHDGDYVFIRGRFARKLESGSFVFTDGKGSIEVKFSEGTLPKDFTLDEDYMVWGQVHRENVIAIYMQALLLSPRRLPPCDGKNCQGFQLPGEDGREAAHGGRIGGGAAQAECRDPAAPSGEAGASGASPQSK